MRIHVILFMDQGPILQVLMDLNQTLQPDGSGYQNLKPFCSYLNLKRKLFLKLISNFFRFSIVRQNFFRLIKALKIEFISAY